jgi:hypothetical protein
MAGAGLKECWDAIAAGNCQVLAGRRAGALLAGPAGPRLAPGASVRPDLAVASGACNPQPPLQGKERDPGRNGGLCPASLTV